MHLNLNIPASAFMQLTSPPPTTVYLCPVLAAAYQVTIPRIEIRARQRSSQFVRFWRRTSNKSPFLSTPRFLCAVISHVVDRLQDKSVDRSIGCVCVWM